MQSSFIAEKWLFETLTDDTQLSALVGAVFVDGIPDGVQPPKRYIYITNQDANDVSYVGKRIGWGNLIYAVRVVGETEGYGSLVSASERMHVLLHRQRGTTEAGEVMACYREKPFRMTERTADRQWRHLGGIYRILVK